jgi:hypothetical protein
MKPEPERDQRECTGSFPCAAASAPEQGEQQDDRQRDAENPEQKTLSKAHDVTPVCRSMPESTR